MLRRVRLGMAALSIAVTGALGAYIFAPGTPALASVTVVETGSRVLVDGFITAGGRPVQGAVVVAQLPEPAATGWTFATAARARTGKTGAFTLRLPSVRSGPTRSYILWFRVTARAHWVHRWVLPKAGHRLALHVILSKAMAVLGLPVFVY